jgi:hypothetical protein
MRVAACRVHGFTLIEFLAFLCMTALVVVGGFVGSGAIEGRFGWMVGGIAGFAAFVVGGLVCAWFLQRFFIGNPRLPTCREGSCVAKDYTLEELHGDYDWVCRHGIRYKRKGRRFVVVDGSGNETPYLIWRPFKGWRSDSAIARNGN